MSENISIDPAQTGINQLQEIADGAKKHAEDVRQALASLNSGDITKALEACRKAHKSYTDAVAKANEDYNKNAGVDGITEEKKKQLEKARDEDIRVAGEKYLKEISEKYSDVVEKFINIVSEKGQTGKKPGAFDITFEDIGSLMQMIQTVIKGEQIETNLNELSNDVKQCIQNINPNFGTREIGKIKDLARLAERSESETSAAAQEFINNTEDADKKFREAISNIVKDYEKGVQESKKEDKKFLSTIASLQTELNKKLKEAKDSNSDSAVAQAFEEKNEARNYLLNVMKQRLEGTKFDADVMTDAILGHAGSREKLQANYEKASKSYEDFKAAMIKEDKFSGRLFKAFTHKGGFRASIKEDIRKDFENWGYGGPKNLGGLLRAKFTHWVLTRHDKKKLDSNNAIDETIVYEKEIKKKIETTIAERNKILDKIKKTKDKIDNIGDADKGLIQTENQNLLRETDEGKKEKIAFKIKKLQETKEANVAALKLLEDEYKEKQLYVQKYTSSARGVGAITEAEEIEFNKSDELVGDKNTSSNETINTTHVSNGEISSHAVGKRNIEDGLHIVGEEGAELLSKQGNSVSIMQIKPDASAPASIGIAPKTQEKPAMESGAEFERKQQETNDRHAISKNVETIVELLREGNELAKKNKEEKKEGGGLFELLGALAGTVLPKLLNAFNALKRALNFARAGLKALGKLPGMLMSKFGGLGKFLSSIFGKGGKLAGIFGKVGNFFSSIFGKGGKLAGIFSKIGGIFSKGGFIGKLVKGFGSIFKIFGPVIKTIAPFFKVLGKLFLPLRVLFTALDVFKGWTDKDMHKKMFNLKEGQEATAGQKYQATLSSVFSGLTFGLMDPVEMHKFLSTGFTGIFYNGLGKLIDFGCDFFNAKDKWAFVKEKLGNVKEAIKEGFGRLGEWFSESWRNAKAWVSDAVSSLWEKTKNGFFSLGEWFTEAWSNAKTWVAETASSMWEGIKNCFSKIGVWFSEKSSEAWNSLKENNPITILMKGISSFGEWISGKASEIWNSLKETSFFKILETGFGRIGGYFTERLDMISNFIKENNPFKWISDGFGAVKKWFEEKYQNISATMEEYNPLKPLFGLFEKIKGFFASLSPSAIARSILPESLIKLLPLDETPVPEPRKFAEGGIVNPSKDGQLAIVGEGGEKEAIMPMSKLASLVLESFKLLKPSEDTHHGNKEGSIFSRMLNSFRTGKKPQKVEDYLFSIDETTKAMQKDVESIYKMVRFIKVDGVALGDMLDHPTNSKLQTPGGIMQGGARAGADSAQYAAALANPQGYAGDSPSGNAAPFAGGKKAPGIGGRYGAIAGKRDELVLAKSQRALNAKGNHMDWSQATNNPGNVGNTDQGGTYIFPDLQSGLKAQRDLLKEKYTKDKQGNRLTLTQMCQKYTPTCWRTALPTWSKYSGIGVNEVPDLDNPQVMARLMKAIHIAEGSASWVSHDEVDYALGLKQMPQGYQKKDYRQLTEKGKALLAQGSPQEQTMNPAPSPSTPPSAGIPPAPPSGGESMPVANPGGTSTPPSGGGSMPLSNPYNGGNINPGNAKDALTPESLNKLSGVHPELRKRFLAAAAEFYSRYHQKLSVVSGKRSEGKQAQLKAKLGGNAAGGSRQLPDGSISYAPHVCGLALDVHGIGENKRSTIDLLANSGILEKYGLWRPLVNGNGSCKPEYWHIEPKGSRDPGAYGLVSGIITNRTAARFGITDKLGNGNFSESSGDIQAVPQDKPENFDIPGMNGGPVPGAPSPSPAQTAIPNVRFGGGGMSPTPPPGGTMQPAAPAPSAPPSMGMGQPGGGQPSYGGGNLASRLLGIAKKNADISGVHGYSQNNREGTNQFDCSSFVGRSLQEAGYNVGSISNFTTATMGGILENLGFQWHYGLDGAQPGDIMFRKGHTEIYIGGGKTIGALNSTRGVGIHPVGWGKYTGYWRDGAIAQMSPEEQAAAQASMAGGPVPGIPGQGGNIQGAMQGVQQPDMGQLGGQTAGPQIQGSPQAQAQQAATAYYESGGGGGGNVYAPTTNVMGGGGNADKGGATFLTTKDPMSWIILQGNTVH